MMTVKRLVTAIVFAVFLATIAHAEYRELTPQQAQQAIAANPGIVILDIRTPAEFRSGHIYGAHNIDFYRKDFAQRIGLLDLNATYFIYCRSGRRSGIALQIMRKAGLRNVFHLKRGINAWKASKQPLSY